MEIEEISREAWLAAQKKARVYKGGPYWRWEHVCWGRGGVPSNSVPFTTQEVAFRRAWNHVGACVR